MRRRRIRPEEDAQIDMTPMLDVVFIMLIFFIVTTSFVRESGVEVNRPKAASASEQKNAGVFIAVKENGEIYLDRKQLDVQKVHSVLERIIAERGEVGLVIQADELARHGVVVKVMDAAKSAGIKQISVAAEQP
ncbi:MULTISPECIES: biopolymer transporter ExbD [unclassified Motilimonas]|uniref:ExbD/TolR family protein n=1 Tax=Motilimonas TaxID=1914248 RepID=UPI001E35A9CE|nr:MULTISPECIES: biopolymer transporter ExbD [unclassified Motilimonas]MCE0557150.1 biopolymer transporter ExbD [Motilimonas sp. E26]MDO6524385.1 biopolymer transporter ExbD [Motilimonas sp. 1_MG-2023]